MSSTDSPHPATAAIRTRLIGDLDPVLTDEEVEFCASTTCVDHGPEGPSGYLQWHAWAEGMSKTHKQLLCGECLLWKIVVPKAPEGTVR